MGHHQPRTAPDSPKKHNRPRNIHGPEILWSQGEIQALQIRPALKLTQQPLDDLDVFCDLAMGHKPWYIPFCEDKLFW